MANLKPLFSSNSAEWETPQELFDRLHAEFGFALDVCAQPHNAKCANYYTPEQDGLSQPWTGVCWCNPPYGRGVERWVAKAAESARAGATVVMLLPARTDTSWFHRWIWDAEHHRPRPGVEVRFLRGRLRFGNAATGAPFPSMVVIFRPTVEAARAEEAVAVVQARAAEPGDAVRPYEAGR